MRRFVLVPMILAFLFTGCSNNSDADMGDATTTTDERVTGTGPTGPVSEFCGLAQRYQTELLTSLVTLLLPTADIAQSKKTVENTRAAVAALRDSAPPELVDDTKLVASEINQLLDAFVAVDFDSKRLSPDATKFQDSPGFSAALKAIIDYAAKSCGVQVPLNTTTTTKS